MLSASSRGPGRTSAAPTRAEVKMRPHALAWNMGTTGSTVSRPDRSLASGSAVASECSASERWE